MRLLQVCTLQEGLIALRVVTGFNTEDVAGEEEDVVVDSPVVSLPNTVADEEEEDVVVDGPSQDCAAEAGTSTQHSRPAGEFPMQDRALLLRGLAVFGLPLVLIICG